MTELPQFHQNKLELPSIDQATLTQCLADLQTAVLKGVEVIEAGDPPNGQYDGRGIFSGQLGIALTYLRLAHQSLSFAKPGSPTPDFKALAAARIPKQGPDFPLQIGGLSPLPSKSPIAAVSLRILQVLSTSEADSIAEEDVACLDDAVDLALSHGATGFYHGHTLGADEVFFGRAGLLWSLVNIRARVPGPSEPLKSVFEKTPDLVKAIIHSGREGAAQYVKDHGEEGALPLMWIWKPGGYRIGWARGLTGIISVLLACPEISSSSTYLREIGDTITALCTLCVQHNGHVPTTIPPHSSSRDSPLVQICHGAPAILGLLGCALKCNLLWGHWTPEWEQAATLATERVWEEGLLSKGGGLCHGIAGNAWPLLLLHDAYEYHASKLHDAREKHAARSGQPISGAREIKITSNYFLARALAMLLHARETQPFAQPSAEYRMPDHPYSLYEGLGGTVCAWADTCAAIKAKLVKMEMDRGGMGVEEGGVLRTWSEMQLGFPCLGGGTVGLF